MSVVIHPVKTRRNYRDPVNDAIFYGTAVIHGLFKILLESGRRHETGGTAFSAC